MKKGVLLHERIADMEQNPMPPLSFFICKMAQKNADNSAGTPKNTTIP